MANSPALLLPLLLLGFVLFVALPLLVSADDPYRYFTWTVTYGDIYPLGSKQQGILINGQFPGPRIDCVTNDNIIVNVINKIDGPFLITWNGIKQRKNSWQDGVLGTNCPIPPNSNYTYKFQTKDQIGSFFYFPSVGMQRAAGGFGALNVYQRPLIPVPYPTPSGDFTLLIGDWYRTGHKVLQQTLDSGKDLSFPDGLIINGGQPTAFNGDQGKTYLFRISNVGLTNSINFRIQNHKLKLVEVEGTHTLQNIYDSLDIYVGQSLAVLWLELPGHWLHPAQPPYQIHGSMQQARTFRWNLTASAARPNPQGSYHYGTIPRARSLHIFNSAPMIGGKQRYAVNGVSYVVPDTPLKLADNFNIANVFAWDSLPFPPTAGPAVLGTPVVRFNLHDFIEIVFENTDNTIQTWHLDGYDFWVVGYGLGKWTQNVTKSYNLVDAVTRHTVQVYPNGWSAILVSLDNEGMWNLRSSMWARQYLGQQFYFRVWTPQKSNSNEYDIPRMLYCVARLLVSTISRNLRNYFVC
uniref:L-ascorbate oxidase homolog n=1 Tax=Ananas comosus var. bracteatus TaxID=296719 RepID=A0A6V7PC62_ANACO|nr:unnamed protein product [Ananas comosus var. bracteatus]